MFCWKKNQDKENNSYGKVVLQTQVQEHKSEYLALSNKEQVELLTMFTEWKETKKTGVHVMAKSKINNITQTLKAVENEACMSFVESVSDISSHLLAHKPPLLYRCSPPRLSQQNGRLRRLGDESGTRLLWKNGWPFTNLSQVSSVLPDLQMLCNRWDDGTTYWRSLSDKEFKKLHLEHEEKLKSGAIIDCHRCTQSDKGTKHRSAVTPATTHHKQYKSSETIKDSKDEEPPVPAVCNTESAVHGDDYIPFDYDKVLADLNQIFSPTPMLE
ncbi:hypothetical protein EV702DRAFT_1051865 [Suillus placidus]|uniref:Uncharacterized protein n=1 Tax=Suillus placidus TaxID=48579 RepID=A0A9P7CUU1_9AGAM|nr:hypothetical protein EV702DRAFT_1051865 [Suillus placidus]